MVEHHHRRTKYADDVHSLYSMKLPASSFHFRMRESPQLDKDARSFSDEDDPRCIAGKSSLLERLPREKECDEQRACHKKQKESERELNSYVPPNVHLCLFAAGWTLPVSDSLIPGRTVHTGSATGLRSTYP